MGLLSMKRVKKKGKKNAPEVCCDSNGEEYPWGLQVTLRAEELKKLKIKAKDFAIDEDADLYAAIRVKTLESDEIRFQITQMEITPKKKKEK